MKICPISMRSLVFLLILTSLSSAYENQLFQDIDFKYQDGYSITDYEFSRNPAVFNMGVDRDYNLYRTYNGLLQNNNKRLFDPSMNRSYGVSFFSNKILDQKSTLQRQ